MTIFELTNDELLAIAEEDWNRSDTHYKDLFTVMENDIKRYWLMNDPSLAPTHGEQKSIQPSVRSNLKLSYARARIETAVSLMISAMFAGGDKWLAANFEFDLLANDQVKRQTLVEMFKRHRLNQVSADQMNLIDSVEGFLLQSALTYWSVGYVGWNRSGGWIRKEQIKPSDREKNDESYLKSKLTAALNYFKMSRIETKGQSKLAYDPRSGFEWQEDKYNHPTFHQIHTFNSRPDPQGGRNFNECAFFMDELRIPWRSLRANECTKDNPFGIYINLDKLQEITEGEEHRTGEEELHERIGEAAGMSPTEEREKKEKKQTSFRQSVVLRRYWTEHGYFMADKKFQVIIRLQATDGWPLLKRCWTYDTRFDAQSAMRLLRNHDEAIDTIANLRIDALPASIEGIRFVDQSRISEDDKGKPMSSNTEVYTLGDPRNAVMIDRAPEVGQQSLQDIQLIRNDGDSLFHINENTLGQFFQFARKATEIQKVDEYQANYTGQKIEEVERTIITPILNKITSLELLYRFKDEKLSWFDSNLGYNRVETLTREDFEMYANAIRYEAQGSRWVNEHERMAAGIMNAFNMTMNNQTTAQISNAAAIHQLVWKHVGNMVDPQDLLSPEAQDRFSIQPEYEWVLMQMGVDLETHRNDDHQEHRKVHEQQRVGGEAAGMSPAILQLLDNHIEKTDDAIAAMSTTNPTGMMGPVLPGQELSQFTQGTQGANLGNPQPNNVMPANLAALPQELVK